MGKKIKIIGNPQKPVFLKDLEDGAYGFISEDAVLVDKPINKKHNNCAINLLAFVYGKADEENYIPVFAKKDGIEIDLSAIILYDFISIDDLPFGDSFKWVKIYVDVGLSSIYEPEDHKEILKTKELDVSNIKRSDLEKKSLAELKVLSKKFIEKELYELAADCRDIEKKKLKK